MLNPMTRVLCSIDLRSVLIRIECCADRLVANCVSEDLNSTAVKFRNSLLVFCNVPKQLPRERGIIVIGRQHRRRVGFDHSVHKELDRAGGNPIIVITIPRFYDFAQLLLADFWRIDPVSEIETKRKLTLALQFLDQINVVQVIAQRINFGQPMHACHSELVRQLYPRHQNLQLLLTAWLGNCAANDGIGGILFYGPSRLAGFGVTHERSTRWIGGVLGYMRDLKRVAVCPPSMPVKSIEIHRTIRNDFVQVLLIWHTGGSKHRIVPSAAQHPSFVRMRLSIGPHPVLDLRDTLDSIQIYLLKQQRTFHEVNVTIREAWEHQVALRIDDSGGRTTKAADLAITANSQYLSIADCQSFRPGVLGIQSVNSAMKQDGICGALGRLRFE